MNFCISSSIEVKIHENIFQKMKAYKDITCDLMDILRFDSKRRIVRFISLKELWKTGLIIKKYIEYPCHAYSELENVFSEMNDYLKKGG